LNGILLIDKPEGPTSADVVRHVSRLLPSHRVGHLGSLDPFATGVLPLCVGSGTKIAQFLNTAEKEYEGVVRLGTATDTGDRTGKVVRIAKVPEISEGQLRDAERRFTGEYDQIPPMYSALKRDGIPLYKLARKGIEIDRAPRRVHVLAIGLDQVAADLLKLRVSCSKGTYIRVLAEDIGRHLGSVACLESLQRTRFGRFELRDAVPLASLRPESPAGWVTLRQALSHLPFVELNSQQTAAVVRGQGAVLRELENLPVADQVVLLDPTGSPVALISRQGKGWIFARVLANRAFFTTS